jgi:hypothetical protein
MVSPRIPVWLVAGALAGCNAAPAGGSVRINPDPATSSDTLRLEIVEDATDANGDAVEYLINWQRDGETIDALRGNETVTPDRTRRGELWSVTVTPSDTKKFGPVLTAAAEIRNGLPRVDSLSLQPTRPTSRDTVVATASTSDADGDAVTLEYAWTVDGTTVAATGAELSPEYFGGGDEIRVTVTPHDGTEAGEPVTSEPVVAGNTRPSISGVEIQPGGRVTTESVLTCVPVGWSDADGDPPGYTFDWTRNGTPIAAVAVLDVGGSSDGDALQCTVTPFDGTDEGTPMSSTVVTVGDEITIGCDPVEMPADPYVGRSFEPNQVAVSGTFAVDGATDEARGWCGAEGEIPLSIDLIIYNASFASTGSAADVCAVRLVPDSGRAPLGEHLFRAALTGSEVSYGHHGFTLTAGSFTAVDYRFESGIGTIGSCLARRYNSSRWGDDFGEVLEAQDWGLYVGEMSAEIDTAFSDPFNDDPSDPEDLYSLHSAGYVIGASQQASAYVGTQVFFAGLIYEVDDGDWTLVPDGGTPYTRVRASTAVPGTRNPSEAIYSISSYLYVWQAGPLLIGVPN